jgi:hypothetical protein
MRFRRHIDHHDDRLARLAERETVRRLARESLERDPLSSALELELLARRPRAC